MKHPAKLRLRLRGAAALLALLALAAGAVFALRGRAQAAEWAFEPEPGQVFAAFGNLSLIHIWPAAARRHSPRARHAPGYPLL